MNAERIKEHSRITVTWRDEDGKLRPANFYVFKKFKDSMIVRATDKDGLMRKVAFDDIIKIVKEKEVAPQDRFVVPDAVLDEKTWKGFTVMNRYSSTPHKGK